MGNPAAIGAWSGALVCASIVPYAIRTYERKIQPVAMSWVLWAFLGLAVLVTYRSAGAESNVWPAVFGFANPAVIAILCACGRAEWKKPSRAERFCFAVGVVSLAMWAFVRHRVALAQYALYIAMAADLCAAIPTILFVWRQPDRDRPFAWVLYAAGYFLAVFAIPRDTLANWILPVYMIALALIVAFPLVRYRLRLRVPLTQWL